jgi:hypothetical protein
MVAVSCILVWRGTWLGWDVLYEYTHPQNQNQNTPFGDGPSTNYVKSTDPGHATTSGVLSHVLAVSALVGTGLFALAVLYDIATSAMVCFLL